MTTTNHVTGTDAGPDRAQAELLDVKRVATMIGVSARSVYRLADAGKLPRPLKLGSLVRWRAAELRQWIADGCPSVRSVKGGAQMIAKRWNESNEGEGAKAAAHAVLEARRDVYVNRGRRELLKALLIAGTATADDVRLAVDIPDCIDPVCLGAVPGPLARVGIIRRAGFAQTTRAAGHARPVTVWELIDRAAALRWLAAHPDVSDPAAKAEPDSTLFD